MKGRLIHIVLLLLVLLVRAQGQTVPFHQLVDKNKGLPNNSVYDIFQDKDGFMWFATNGGLFRYDGFRFQSYPSDNVQSKSGSNIQQDKYGRIWYCSFDGCLQYLDGDSLHTLKTKEKVDYHYLIIDDCILVTFMREIHLLDLKTFADRKYLKKLDTDYFTPVGVAKGYLYFFVGDTHTANDLYRINQEGEMEQVDWVDATIPPMSFLEEYKNSLYGLSALNLQNSIARYSLGNGAKTRLFFEPKPIRNTCVAGDYLWLCTHEGVWAMDELGNWHHFFPNTSITCVSSDREGNYWFGTSDEGCFLVFDLKTNINVYKDLKITKIDVFNKNLWLSTNIGEVWELNDIKHLQEKTLIHTSTSRHAINFTGLDTIGQNFLMVSDKFHTINENRDKQVSSGLAIKDFVRVDEKYYAVSYSGGIGFLETGEGKDKHSVWDSLHKQHYNHDNPLWISHVVLLRRAKSLAYFPQKQLIYYATNDGLYQTTPKGATLVKNDKGEDVFLKKTRTYDQVIIAISADGKLLRISPDNANKIEELEVLVDGKKYVVNDIKIIGDELFVFGEGGLVFADLSAKRLVFKPMTLIPKLSQPRDLEIWNDRLIVAFDDRLLLLDTPYVGKKEMPLLVINHLKIDGEKYDFSKPIQAFYPSKDVEIDYSILSFNTDGEYPAYYQINDEEWKLLPAESRQLNFASLAPGDYVLRFRLGKDAGTAIQELSFYIKPPFWQTWWFLAVNFVLVAALGYAYYRWQTGLLKRKNALELEKVELERNLQQSVLTAIRSQMNPHFFYNALNTIQAYIFTGDKKNALHYLSMFSKLTRWVLETSEKEKIYLAEEMSALKLYLDLEKARFEDDDFHYQLLASPAVQTDHVQLPPMIVQPYIENAIKHGLLHKKGDKKLEVYFDIYDNNLLIKVEDNGIGRAKSAEINRQKNSNHKSFATHANEKRIEILNKGKKNIAVSYTDKTDENGNPAGTLVELSIPIL